MIHRNKMCQFWKFRLTCTGLKHVRLCEGESDHSRIFISLWRLVLLKRHLKIIVLLRRRDMSRLIHGEFYGKIRGIILGWSHTVSGKISEHEWWNTSLWERKWWKPNWNCSWVLFLRCFTDPLMIFIHSCSIKAPIAEFACRSTYETCKG